jgi:16S rRNA processing protein RimM
MGVVGAPHGVRGAIRIKSFTDDPRAVAQYGALEDESGERRFTLHITGTANGEGMVIARLSGVADRDAAEALRGLRLYAPRAALPAPAKDEFYHADLIGLRAMTREGEDLGRIVALRNFGAGDILEIAPKAGGETVLLPFTKAVAPEIDIAGGRIVIAPPRVIEGEAGGER